ncbi:MAG TPA: Crp/Fnr family transcriptional regulator [Microvirga sp.]|jgi:CRP-like cAMP-binding protein|nr:Crp/Fnr family transcriptional regulator [Microvirga sp.]
MALEHDIAVLSRAPLFHLLDRDALRLVAFAAEGRSLRAGDVLFRRGDASDGGYVVGAGAIVLDAEDGATDPFVAGPGALIGQAALFADVDRPATAVAQEPSAVMRISPNVMRRVLEEFPTAAAAMEDVLAGELAELTEGLERVRRTLAAIDGEA